MCMANYFKIQEKDEYKSSVQPLKKQKHFDPSDIKDAQQKTKWALERRPEEYKVINPKTGVRFIRVWNRKQTVAFETFFKVCKDVVCLYGMSYTLHKWLM